MRTVIFTVSDVLGSRSLDAFAMQRHGKHWGNVTVKLVILSLHETQIRARPKVARNAFKGVSRPILRLAVQ